MLHISSTKLILLLFLHIFLRYFPLDMYNNRLYFLGEYKDYPDATKSRKRGVFAVLNVESKIRFSYIDYKNMQESETKHYELLDGEITMVPSPSYEHQSVSRNLELALWDFVRKNALGTVLDAPFDVHLGKDVVQPDIIYISKKRRNIIKADEVHGAPDIVVEILSPSTAQRDRIYKKKLYAKSGVKGYWIVDTDEKVIEVFTLKKPGYGKVSKYKINQLLTSALLPGLEINIKEIFTEG